MLNKIRAALSGGLLAALATLALPASAQVHQYVTGNEQTDSRLQIQISWATNLIPICLPLR